MTLVGLGVAIGVPSALAANHLLTSMLFGWKATDPLVLAGATLFLFFVAAGAAYLPAYRATTIDPMVALRYE